jgi:hypothetical protein
MIAEPGRLDEIVAQLGARHTLVRDLLVITRRRTEARPGGLKGRPVPTPVSRESDQQKTISRMIPGMMKSRNPKTIAMISTVS